MKPQQIANSRARALVQRRMPFDGSNTYGRIYPPNEHCLNTRYVVYSYGEHFPLFVAETGEDGRTDWYENADRYSPTTSKHRSQLHPHAQTMPMTTEKMKTLARYGIAGVAVGKGEAFEFEDVPY